MNEVQLIECPRDAIQGWPVEVTTNDKLAYYKALLGIGFDTIDIGSFVSHRAVPQMADTREVLNKLHDEGMFESNSRILTIVANERGAIDATQVPGVTDMGFPLSLSETFQQRNTGATVEQAWHRLERVKHHCERHGKQLVVYLSMGFGNPYGDDWSPNVLTDFIGHLAERIQPQVIALSDTIGAADPETISSAFDSAISHFDSISFGAHLHAHPHEVESKIKAAFDSGCRRFDGAIRGIGGCPMAQDELVGNIPTEQLISYFENFEAWKLPNQRAWEHAMSIAVDLFQD
ncbi:MAG: hydroxymethylglutaryl-CoA lyase [Crocinitomicaceae bacterium]|nr:hydroxymethylglutaryl-CoA lyase [Crocinitomicaceae bacterium]